MSDDVQEWLDFGHNARGFRWMPQLLGLYGGYVRVRESSMASFPCLWLDVAEPLDANNPDGEVKPFSTVHLTLDDAEKLIGQLNWFVNNHYLLREGDS